MNLPIIYYPSKVKYFLLFLISLVFVVIGYFMIQDTLLFGFIVLSFFGLCLLVFGYSLFFNSGYLKITNEGFEIKTLIKKYYTPWSDVTEFKVGKSNVIYYNYVENPSIKINETARGLAKNLSGFDAGISNVYKVKINDLCETLNNAKRFSIS